MNKILIRPDKYQQFGDGQESTFYLITNPQYADKFHIDCVDGAYKDYKIILFGQDDDFLDILTEQITEPAHILVISPNCLFSSPSPENLGARRKLAVLACNSTPTTLEDIDHFIKAIELTDVEEQQSFADDFFSSCEAADYLLIKDEEYQTTATFNHWSDDFEWFQQAGSMDWGSQQLVPSGEISVLPLSHGAYSHHSKLSVNGQLTLKGYPILHSGKPSFLREDQARIFEALSSMKDNALIATIENGVIVKLESPDGIENSALNILQTMFKVDSRYRIIWEIGFGINTKLTMLSGNLGMNEVYGAEQGAVHWGLGLTPWTQYHLDIICPGTKIFTNLGEKLIGNTLSKSITSRKIERTSASVCPCIT